MNQLVIVLDFAGQYSHLIARRVRECGVYCEVLPHTASVNKIRERSPGAIIFSGGPAGLLAGGSGKEAGLPELGIPILCIGCGAGLAAQPGRERALESNDQAAIQVGESELFAGLPESFICRMSHPDCFPAAPEGFTVIGKTETCPRAALEDKERRIYALLFHPESERTEYGKEILRNFLHRIAGLDKNWGMRGYVKDQTAWLKAKIGGKKALCALSGGVDSTVAAVMAHKAAGGRLTCIFVDHGLLRKNEGDQVEALCREKFHMNFLRINAQDRFLEKLRGVADPEKKRKIIGEEFIRVFEEEAKKLGSIDFLIQGTIYPDIIESSSAGGAAIKSHHNVGGLPDHIDFKEILEPLRMLFKDEVRMAGLELGIDEDIVWRQPFPGPGLAVRVIGDLTREKLDTVREADAIFREEIKVAGLEREIHQYFAVLTNVQSVGVTGDARTYGYTIALRAVATQDFMTADFARIPYSVLERASGRITREVENVNRVVYDITPKPPSTIEWE